MEGRRINRLSLLLAAALPALARAALQSDPRFGVMTHFAQGWNLSWTSSVAEASVPSVRDELYWDVVERKPGTFAFPAFYDRYMAELRSADIRPLIVLDFENRNYDRGQTPDDADGYAAYARYAVQVLRRYGAQIREVEIWNEYNGTFCKGPAARNRVDNYLGLLRAAYTAIKRERPDVTVVGGATSEIPLPYWDKLLAAGALSYMDALSVHPYRYLSPPEGLECEIAGLDALVRKYNNGSPRPIWVTEIGWYTKTSAAPGDLAIDGGEQAKFLVRAYALLLSAGVERIYWYMLHDGEGLGMGLFGDDPKRTPKPACTAMATMIRQLSGARFLRREPTPPNLYSLVFEKPSGEQVRVLWSLKPATVPENGADEVTNLNGEIQAPAASLCLSDSPLFVTGPLGGLPPPPRDSEKVVTDSKRDFSRVQGKYGWSYGVFVGAGANFVPLPTLEVTDWAEVWTGRYPYVALASGDQHPSAVGSTPVSAVRRWESGFDGTVRIAGRFLCSIQGDGVGVSIWVDGHRLFRTLLGGGRGNSIVKDFDLVESVRRGTCVDFSVDPGPAANIDFDATSVSAVITAASP